jgi:hypothetical protein
LSACTGICRQAEGAPPLTVRASVRGSVWARLCHTSSFTSGRGVVDFAARLKKRTLIAASAVRKTKLKGAEGDEKECEKKSEREDFC